jgi:hypothetical protein
MQTTITARWQRRTLSGTPLPPRDWPAWRAGTATPPCLLIRRLERCASPADANQEAR